MGSAGLSDTKPTGRVTSTTSWLTVKREGAGLEAGSTFAATAGPAVIVLQTDVPKSRLESTTFVHVAIATTLAAAMIGAVTRPGSTACDAGGWSPRCTARDGGAGPGWHIAVV